MKVYIPKHLRNLEIVDQMYNMIKSYSENYTESEDSFNLYQSNLKYDPVRVFVESRVTGDDISSDQDYDTVINYLTELFYSVKGTVKVFTYMEEYLNLGVTRGSSWYTYTPAILTVDLQNLDVPDSSVFYTQLYNFLSALLYFGMLQIEGNLNITLKEEIVSYYGSDCLCYKETELNINDIVNY